MNTLKKICSGLMTFLVLALVLIPVAALADTAPADPTLDFISQVIAAVGGLKGAGGLAIAAAVVQLLIKLLSLPAIGGLFPAAKGWIKLLIVSGLTMIATPLSLMVTAPGTSWGAALVSGATLSAVMVFINQVYQHFTEAAAPSS